uniref:Uncharacterized protein n=1 Tax=Glossina pallidipes TaxID=7398 RepID=A0A1A9Z312_GLOPL
MIGVNTVLRNYQIFTVPFSKWNYSSFRETQHCQDLEERFILIVLLMWNSTTSTTCVLTVNIYNIACLSVIFVLNVRQLSIKCYNKREREKEGGPKAYNIMFSKAIKYERSTALQLSAYVLGKYTDLVVAILILLSRLQYLARCIMQLTVYIA